MKRLASELFWFALATFNIAALAYWVDGWAVHVMFGAVVLALACDRILIASYRRLIAALKDARELSEVAR